jgi:arabinogalactan endo-1,4-beta-galactosidase
MRHPTTRAHCTSLFVAFVALASALTAQAESSMDDRFNGTAVDACRWDVQNYFGSVAQDGALQLSTPGLATVESARVLTQARLTGDFDIQVDYLRIAGFATAPVSPPGNIAQLRLSLGLWWDDARYIQFARMRHAGGDVINVLSSVPGYPSDTLPQVDATTDSGKLRIIRTGTRLRFLHSTGGTFVEVAAMDAPATPVFAYLDTVNVPVARALNVRFDNFLVNAGANDDITWTPPNAFLKRPGFALGGVTENWPALRYFGNSLAAGDAWALFRQNGMEWVRVGVTTQSHPELDAIPLQSWRTLGLKAGYWGSREYAARTLLDAAERGMRLYAYLYFSDQAANWGNQKAPDSWAGKSVAETAALMEEHAYDTAMYFKSKGLEVEIYELGNETDIGMVDFLPNRRIPVPPGVDFVNDRTWLRENVWSVQAILLKAAAAGIRRAAPNARVAVHASSLESGTGSQMGPDFFRAMRDFGVDYDIAAISHPYAQNSTEWSLSRYSTACWQKRFARIVDEIAVPGKPVMMVEASYQSSPETLLSAPMPDFPFTPQGQAAFAREMFRFATSHPSIVGWFWFYPEFQAGITDPNNEGYVLQYGSLLTPTLEARPALAEFRPNLGPPSANTVEYFNAGFGHYFITANQNEIAVLDGGAFGGAWTRTGSSFMTHARPATATAPVCRFFSTSFAPKSSHFYTADAAECEKLKANPDWQFEAIAFHSPLPDGTGACPAGTDPLYRLYNNGQTGAPNHRFTTDLATRNDHVANRGFVSEGLGPLGVALCVPR